jgi:H/ACA ribonucleoprotein complex subunit 3
MKTSIKKCAICGKYTLKDICPRCKNVASSPAPAKFSPEDRYGEYRRISIIEEYGENGKHRDL